MLTNGANWFIKKYGKLVTKIYVYTHKILRIVQVGLYLGNYPAVVVYDYEIARDLFNQDIVSGRPDNFAYRFRMLGGKLG